MNSLSLTIAFTAGIVSFLSPCVLPIIPGFLAYLAGTSVAEASKKRMQMFINSFFFVLGFASIFSLLGVLLNSVLEAVAYTAQSWLARIGGALIILFGLYLIGLIKLPWLEREYKFRVSTRLNSRYLTSFLFGAAFAAGWTPCVGAVLGTILGLAATAPGSAFSLLFTYSLGLGIPFLVVGLFALPAARSIEKYARYARIVSVVFGVLLVVIGILAFTQNLQLLANFGALNEFLLQ